MAPRPVGPHPPAAVTTKVDPGLGATTVPICCGRATGVPKGLWKPFPCHSDSSAREAANPTARPFHRVSSEGSHESPLRRKVAPHEPKAGGRTSGSGNRPGHSLGGQYGELMTY